MKCQKCPKPAIVHLTEVVSDANGVKRAVEIHLCLGHASEAGLVAPGHGVELSGKSEEFGSTAIVPAAPAGAGLAVTRDDPAACPICGLTWTSFKTTGLMGCSHDYERFEGKLVPLLKRAQEGASEHVGKVPRGKNTVEADRQVTSLRLRRELQRAIDAENYEAAARLRDQLRQIEN